MGFDILAQRERIKQEQRNQAEIEERRIALLMSVDQYAKTIYQRSQKVASAWRGESDLMSWNGKPKEYVRMTSWRNYQDEIQHQYGIQLQSLNQLIKQATLAECLTSPYEYVRECKKYYMKELENEQVSDQSES